VLVLPRAGLQQPLEPNISSIHQRRLKTKESAVPGYALSDTRTCAGQSADHGAAEPVKIRVFRCRFQGKPALDHVRVCRVVLLVECPTDGLILAVGMRAGAMVFMSRQDCWWLINAIHVSGIPRPLPPLGLIRNPTQWAARIICRRVDTGQRHAHCRRQTESVETFRSAHWRD